MEIMNPYIEEFREIKICRLCGIDNKENIDIFTSKPISSRSDDLLTKILTVYPLVLYKNDPLPQHICPKCIGNVSTTYQDIQQVLRQQNKWMNLTKAVQPEHKYFRILDMVEKSTRSTKESIKTSYNIELNNIPLKKLLAGSEIENQKTTAINTNNKTNINENVVKNIQSKLESNGFTIKRIKVSTSTDGNSDLNTTTDSEDLTVNSLGTSAGIVTCNYCKLKFSNVKILAEHQLIHLRLSANKVFQKRVLPKQLRRGRLITINGSKCIRCLNCWRIFKDNKDILQHWSGGDCEFYCFVCGEEFSHSPKKLREHVTTVHGISYRSTGRGLTTSQSELIKPVTFAESTMKSSNIYPMATKIKKVYKKPPPKSCTKNDDGTITCKICHKVFDNFRSSNSHMRKHKPPIRYSEPIFAPAGVMDNYNSQDDYMAQPSTSTSHFRFGHPKPLPTLANSLHMKHPRPAYRVIMKNGPLRGIKTKIVQKRQDFLTDFAANDRHLIHRSMATTSDPNDDDENMIVPELLMPTIKSEPMLGNNTQGKNNDGVQYGEYTNSSLIASIKSEPLDNHSESGETQEPRLCFICNESFSNTRDYELHAMFVHNIN